MDFSPEYQEKTEKAPTKTEKVEKKASTKTAKTMKTKKTYVKKEKTSNVSVASKDKMTHKHHMMKPATMHKKMKGEKKTDSTEKEKSK